MRDRDPHRAGRGDGARDARHHVDLDPRLDTGEELLATAKLIVGDMPAVITCSVEPGASPESYQGQIRAAVKSGQFYPSRKAGLP